MGLLISFVFLLIAAEKIIGSPTHEFNKGTLFTKVVPPSDSSDAIYVTPELLFVGKSDGDILRCLYKDPSVCETFYSYTAETGITSTAISGEYIYMSLGTNVMLKCSLYDKDCTKFYHFISQINALAVSQGFIFVGLQDGRLKRCQLHQADCALFKSFKYGVTSLGATDKYIYVGLESKELWRCLVALEESCRQIDTTAFESAIKGISVVDETVIAVTKGGTFWNCTRGIPCTYQVYTTIPDTQFVSMTAFDSSLYALHNSKILTCRLDKLGNCSSYDRPEVALSISFAYSTYEMQGRFVNEEKTCLSGARCPPFVIYYEINQRPVLEVSVKGGRLYDSQNALVDTTDADLGQSGRAAIFAMGPDGQILMSNVHNSVLRSSSLFAGHPVAGAGEMVVENGVITSIRACSEHYRPTVELNQQVIKALYLKGYTDKIDNLPCCNECQGDVDAADVQ